MTGTTTPRKPAAFRVDAPENEAGPGVGSADGTAKQKPAGRQPASYRMTMVRAEEDPFEAELASEAEDIELMTPPPARIPPRRMSYTKLAMSAFGLLFSLAVGLWIDDLIRSLYARAEWLGWIAVGLTAIGLFAVLVIVWREMAAIMRLNSVHRLRSSAEEAMADPKPTRARRVVKELMSVLASRPDTAAQRKRMKQLDGEIIDAPHLLELAETELLGPLDKQARRTVLAAAKRVSVVTAVSPRALVDIGYVLFEAMRLIRSLSYLYGARPGTIGLLRLSRDVIAHLAVTGSIAVGDGIIQQLVGHGIASKLSARLGEGVINGLMTARIGIAAMDLCRPLPFRHLKRPGMGDFLTELSRQVSGSGNNDKKTG